MRKDIMKKEQKIKFEHLEFTKQEFKKLKLDILTKKSVFSLLNQIHKKNMKKYHSDYCPDAVWRDMQERCILFSNDKKVLISKERFNKIIKIYKTGKVEWPGDFKIEKFNTIAAMFMRNQVSEC